MANGPVSEGDESPAESVWDYPRPPLLETSTRYLTIVHGGVLLAQTRRALRILETSHPPVYYIPPQDIAMQYLQKSGRRGSYCEFKGVAQYWSIDMGPDQKGSIRRIDAAAWSYPDPSLAYAALKDHLAFYASHVDACTVDGERVIPQPGDFYGGWITSHVRGPFKGAPGTLHW